ncbi:MAG: peptidoglycan D,D-transpeptidase FtsI family protein [Luteolibacter sp.]
MRQRHSLPADSALIRLESAASFPRMRALCPFSIATVVIIGGAALCFGEEAPVTIAAPALAPVRSATDGSILTQRDARAITLKIPAPRGQITGREGKPLAQTTVAYQIGLQYPQFDQADQTYIIQWGRTRLDQLQELIKNPLTRSDEELADHYRHRRWLPLFVSGHLDEKQAGDVQSKLPSGLILQPVYRRYYPDGGIAPHVVGYTGRVDRLPTGPINFNEPLWEESEGRAGLEKLFNRELTGVDGQKRLLFDELGNKLLEEQTRRPRAGGTLVTTLNHEWQALAEKVLREGCQRGAFVVIDVATGEVLVMASRPSFDPNAFIPFIGPEEFDAMNNDPGRPLFGRAFQAVYPPASAYKPVVALTALDKGIVTERSLIDCPASITLGRTVMRNHSPRPAGPIDVRRAIASSNNVWFYKVGIQLGANDFLNVSRRLGMGERTGLPLIGEAAGLVPTNDWMLKNERRRFMDGDAANMSIGQGVLLASPLQVAQFMAGIGNGGVLPKLHLIRQVQDSRGRVIRSAEPERRQWLGVSPAAIEIVRDGMRDAVTYGTGRGGAISYTTLAGKTGTAQWGPPRLNQRLAWFAGFLPHDNPRYAFAVLYEGRPGQRVSGGGMAAPMVRKFFEPLKEEISEIIAPPRRALVVVDESAGEVADAPPVREDGPLRALPVEPLDVESELGLAPGTLDPQPLRALPVEEMPELEEFDDSQIIENFNEF